MIWSVLKFQGKQNNMLLNISTTVSKWRTASTFYIGYIQSFIDVPEEEVDISGYTQMSISEARI